MSIVVEHAPPEELVDLVTAYYKQMGAYLSANQNFLTKNFGLGGSAANFESSLTALFTWDSSKMQTGCVPLAYKSLEIIDAHKPKGWTSGHLTIGVDYVAEHHAAIVWKTGQHWKTGTVFDAWVEQKPRVYSYPVWWTEFYALCSVAKPRISNEG